MCVGSQQCCQSLLIECGGQRSAEPVLGSGVYAGLLAGTDVFSLSIPCMYLQSCAGTARRSVALGGRPGILLQLVQGAGDHKLALRQGRHEPRAVAGALLHSMHSVQPSAQGLEAALGAVQAWLAC